MQRRTARGVALLWFLFLILIVSSPPASAAEYRLRNGAIGTVTTCRTGEDDSLVEMARRFDLGYNEIVAANPGIDPFIPDPGTRVVIPSRWIIPDVPRREGIIVNLSEMRLYYFPPRRTHRVVTYPIGIGDEGWETPTGSYRIVEKIVRPAWHVPRSIRREKPELPEVVPPGPDNPLGSHALRLSIGTVLIHGTNRPFGIGRKVSHGCIHLYPEDIPRLFREVRLGTPVSIVRQPVKVAVVAGRVLVEVHGEPGTDLRETAADVVIRRGLVDRVDPRKLMRAARLRTGLLTDVTLENDGR